LKQGYDIRPTIAVTKAHMRLLEMEQSVKEGRLKVDGNIVLNEDGELAVTKGISQVIWGRC
jgi:GTP cyclohydrolase N terminal